MPDFPELLTVSGLFGYLDPTVKLRTAERITILTGPNGTGKTHLLNALRATLALDFRTLGRLPLASLTLDYRSGKSLHVVRDGDEDTGIVTATGRLRSGRRFGPDSIPSSDILDDLALPPFIERVSDDLWIDNRDGEMMSARDVFRRFAPSSVARSAPDGPLPLREPLPEWLISHFKPDAAPTLIATGRLDLGAPVPRARGQFRHSTRPEAIARIRQYAEQIGNLIGDARSSSLGVSQRADRQFAANALDKARSTVQEAELRTRYEEMANLHHELFENGLTVESVGVSVPDGRMNPTERRILSLFLSDWEEKLRPLEPVHAKLQLLREIVGRKMVGKTLTLEGGSLGFRSQGGDPLPVEKLSSGEQHLLALFTMLLFEAGVGSVVLIDEPEISLHAAWKHEFLDDIRRVAEVNDLQVIIATHSTAIINGRWELVEELDAKA